MKFFQVFLLAFGLLVSCQEVERAPKPKNLIPEPEMVNILTDVSLLHGARGYNRTILVEKGIETKDYIWQKYDIDSLRFAQSNNYYSHNYKQYKRIYDSVYNRLESLRMEYDSIRVQQERTNDSIRSAEDELDPLKRRPRRLKDSLVPSDQRGRTVLGPVYIDDSLIRRKADTLVPILPRPKP